MSQNSTKQYKAINFDLDTHKLIEEFGRNGHSKAYATINKYLTSHGCAHRQWSGYRSNYPMMYTEVLDIAVGMFDEFKWLSRCANRFDITNIGREYDVLKYLQQ
jgi:virulence-associated protein VapD